MEAHPDNGSVVRVDILLQGQHVHCLHGAPRFRADAFAAEGVERAEQNQNRRKAQDLFHIPIVYGMVADFHRED